MFVSAGLTAPQVAHATLVDIPSKFERLSALRGSWDNDEVLLQSCPSIRARDWITRVLPDRGSFITNNVHTEGKTRMRLSLPYLRGRLSLTQC